MIRPITLICWVLALSAGLYLYRAKHEVELMDKHIDEIARETTDLRVESRRLLDDWIRLGEPEQLRKYSDQYLGLKPVAPTQFVRMSDLPDRLPTPRPDPVGEPQQPVEQSPLVQLPPLRLPSVKSEGGQTTVQASPETAETDDVEAEEFPVPPIPPPAAPRPASAVPPAFVGSTPAASVPLQARPVSLRPAAAPQDQEPVRQHPVGETLPWDDPHGAPVKPVEPKSAQQVKVVDPRPSAPAAPSAQIRGQDLPPLQAQATAPVQKTVQAPKVPAPQPRAAENAQPRAAENAQPRAAENVQPRAAENPQPRTAETSVSNRSREVSPVSAPAAVPPLAPTPVQAGSLLGMSRGAQPPLPAPTQVNATWPNSGGR